MTVTIDGSSLTIEKTVFVARGFEKVSLSSTAEENIERSHKSLIDLIQSGKMVYGVNTGFGSLLNVRISREDEKDLQANLIRSHSAGVGDRLESEYVRAMMLIRANSLSIGYSGVRKELITTLIKMLNKKILPVVPQFGSVGASGDLAPLAHIALAMMGEGEVYDNGTVRPSIEVLEREGISPYSFAEKEGVAFINGTTAISAILSLELAKSFHLLRTSVNSAALSFEALRGTDKAFTAWAIETRKHNGQKEIASEFRDILLGSKNVKASSEAKIQDAYSLRCIPQVYGAVLDTLNYVKSVVQNEINSVTDNPLIKGNDYVSVGNFHGEPVAFGCDFVSIALTDLGNIIERRIARMVDSNLSGLPPFLVENSGYNSGYMIPQYVAASLCNMNKVLSYPSSADSIPTSANQEDHVSMGMNSALKLIQINKNLERIIAIEFLLGSQGTEFLTLPIAPKVQKVKEIIRKKVPKLTHDRPSYNDINEIIDLMESGKLTSFSNERDMQ
jgi:histidine ammonia-lyase